MISVYSASPNGLSYREMCKQISWATKHMAITYKHSSPSSLNGKSVYIILIAILAQLRVCYENQRMNNSGMTHNFLSVCYYSPSISTVYWPLSSPVWVLLQVSALTVKVYICSTARVTLCSLSSNPSPPLPTTQPPYGHSVVGGEIVRTYWEGEPLQLMTGSLHLTVTIHSLSPTSASLMTALDISGGRDDPPE